jgi:VWFA-related protein
MRPDFEVSTRAVESYATVTYGSGKYADGLRESDFKVLDNRKPVPLRAFESDTSAVSVALLLDMSGSMTGAIPSLRKSALGLVSNLRPIDSVAVFGFSDSVSELQPWTLDKDEAKRALLRTRALDTTELNDALLRLIHDLSARKGKNAIVVFTDGNDTASALGADLVVRRAKENSVRIYTIAEGTALKDPGLALRLASIAAATGGLSFAIPKASQMAAVFQTISQDLAHGYLLTIRPEPDSSRQWHNLEVLLASPQGRAVRARKGFFGAP